MKLRHYQETAIKKVLERFKTHNTALIKMSTGAGKTAIFLSLIKQILEKKPDFRCMILVNKVKLVEQTLARAYDMFDSNLVGEFCGSRDSYELDAPITVASIQSISKVDASHVHMLVIDEAHRLTPDKDSSYMKTIKSMQALNPNLKILGCTATPYRATGLIYGKNMLFDSITYSRGLQELINEGYLVSPTMKRPEHQFETKDLSIKMGDFDQGELAKLTGDKGKVSKQIADAMGRIKDRKKIVWATTNIAHCEMVREAIPEKACMIHSKMDDGEREDHLWEFENTDCRHLVFVSIVSEGYDCLDSKTEVLTESGWKFFNEAKSEKKVYSINPETRDVEIVPIERVFQRPVRGGERFVTIKSQHMDIRVTDKHNFVFSTKKGRKRVLLDGASLSASLPDRCTMFFTGNKMERGGLGLTKEQSWLLGMFWADGYKAKSGKVEIYQTKPKFILKIRNTLKKIGIDYSERTKRVTGYKANHEELRVFSIPKGTHSKSLKRNGYVKIYNNLFDKLPSKKLMQMSDKEFSSFWEGFVDGNGSRQGNKLPRAITRYKEQADFICQKAAELGYAAMATPSITQNQTKIWIVCVRNKNTIDLNFKDSRGAKIVYEAPEEDEKVWCVSNKNGTLITRRNGKIIVIGNCPPVDAVVLMRPTRSPILYVQTIGRGLRISEGKENCIAEGSMVLTDIGLVPIERVTKKMKVWDGVEFVSHDGAVFKGEQEVIEYAQLVATKDHKVYTSKGWKTLAESKREKLPISVTGIGGLACKQSYNYFREDSKEGLKAANSNSVFKLFKKNVERFLQFKKRHSRLQNMWKPKRGYSKMALVTMHGRKTKVRKSKRSCLQKLWRTWNKILFWNGNGDGCLYSRYSWIKKESSNRSNQQQWRLCPQQLAVGDTFGKYGKHQEKQDYNSFSQIQDEVPPNKIRRCNAKKFNFSRLYRQANNKKVLQTIPQAKRRVWDILNAGPRHRFTVNGLLVHNCLVLDYGKVIENCGPLDNPRIPKKGERKGQVVSAPMKFCPSCFEYVHAAVRICPACENEFPKPEISKNLTRKAAQSAHLLGDFWALYSLCFLSSHKSIAGNRTIIIQLFPDTIASRPVKVYATIGDETSKGQFATQRGLELLNKFLPVAGREGMIELWDKLKKMNSQKLEGPFEVKIGYSNGFAQIKEVQRGNAILETKA